MSTNTFKNRYNHSTLFAKTLHQQPLKKGFGEDERNADAENDSNSDSGFTILTPFSTKSAVAYTARGKYYALLASHMSDEEKSQSLKILLECFPNLVECLLKHPSDGFKTNVLNRLSDECLNVAKDYLKDSPKECQFLDQIMSARNANKGYEKITDMIPLFMKTDLMPAA